MTSHPDRLRQILGQGPCSASQIGDALGLSPRLPEWSDAGVDRTHGCCARAGRADGLIRIMANDNV
jgi:hypothetical protein